MQLSIFAFLATACGLAAAGTTISCEDHNGKTAGKCFYMGGNVWQLSDAKRTPGWIGHIYDECTFASGCCYPIFNTDKAVSSYDYNQNCDTVNIN
ncbi:hypothetical protein Pst134EA_000779 [Puccinia striiformis f. sp. tritici]|uniref:hypothetical protein n=1 Tax=Puccinia striiformis f. sp. tritici TaxID=168172 RepID=UPI00200721E6|nr:hypothetical protein Pst134EA_000779 [Puccinia striiformis f. sp. tritici]KAH9466950.1 hypothetical protein Pst134EB_001989 [Puccinia striiformis f. sp. tritici]KAH9473700.1 hypothetical protein Pst134EA_000779 [Puccinia striiformis f. sp. tritici]